MSRFKAPYKFLNDIFANEKDIAESKKFHWLKVITETYESAKQKKLQMFEIASRRFRKKEFYIYTCVMMCISPAKYYRLLSIFFKIAENKIKNIFSDTEKMRIDLEPT